MLTGARLVLADSVVSGTLVMRRGRIAEIETGRSRLPAAVELDGDLLLPGAVDLHTDNLERQVQPRGGVRWPSRSALLAHDGQCAAAGITTVLDALCVGDLGFDEDRPRTCMEGAADLAALAPSGLLKAEHFLHLRCELPAEGLLETLVPLLAHERLRLISLMDHTPGTGQYADLGQYRAMRRRDGEPADVIEDRIGALQAQQLRRRAPNRASLLAIVDRAIVASHDDRSAADVAENLADGIFIAEFPVSLEAGRAARRGGQRVIAGAPNVVRGGSHTGNVRVLDLVREGLVDALASDYVPTSLVEAAFALAREGVLALPEAVSMISAAPASIAGFTDRGRIAAGLRADLIRVRMHEGLPVVRAVWRGGERVG